MNYSLAWLEESLAMFRKERYQRTTRSMEWGRSMTSWVGSLLCTAHAQERPIAAESCILCSVIPSNFRSTNARLNLSTYLGLIWVGQVNLHNRRLSSKGMNKITLRITILSAGDSTVQGVTIPTNRILRRRNAPEFGRSGCSPIFLLDWLAAKSLLSFLKLWIAYCVSIFCASRPERRFFWRFRIGWCPHQCRVAHGKSVRERGCPMTTSRKPCSQFDPQLFMEPNRPRYRGRNLACTWSVSRKAAERVRNLSALGSLFDIWEYSQASSHRNRHFSGATLPVQAQHTQ